MRVRTCHGILCGFDIINSCTDVGTRIFVPHSVVWVLLVLCVPVCHISTHNQGWIAFVYDLPFHWVLLTTPAWRVTLKVSPAFSVAMGRWEPSVRTSCHPHPSSDMVPVKCRNNRFVHQTIWLCWFTVIFICNRVFLRWMRNVPGLLLICFGGRRVAQRWSGISLLFKA